MKKQFRVNIIEGDRPLSEWLAYRIVEDFREKYGVEITVSIDRLNGVDNSSGRLQADALENLPEILDPKDIQAFLKIRQKNTYQFFSNPPIQSCQGRQNDKDPLRDHSLLGLRGVNPNP